MRRSLRVLLGAFLLGGGLGGVSTPAEAATGSGGYMMLAADGRAFAFGDAPFCGHADPLTTFLRRPAPGG